MRCAYGFEKYLRYTSSAVALVPVVIAPRNQIFLTLGVLLVMTACSSAPPEKSKPLVKVQVTHVIRSDISQEVTSDAVLYARDEAIIVPKINAPIKRFYVNRGDHVHAGQLVATLANSDLADAVTETKGVYDQERASYQNVAAGNLPDEIQRAKAAVATSQATYKAASDLYRSSKFLYQQGALAQKQLNQAEVGMIQAREQLQTSQQQLAKLQSVGEKTQLAQAQGQLVAAEGKYKSAQAELNYSTIRSPIDGVVTDRPLYRGQMATSGSALMTIMDLSQIVARAHVPQPEAALLKQGDSASISVPGESNPVWGKVIVVSPALDPNSTTVQVWVEAKNPGEQLKPGTPVTVTVIAKKISNALVVPYSSLLSESDHTAWVMVVDREDYAHRMQVQVGIQQEDQVQITHGLQDGERIVSQNAYGLPDNVRVTY